MIYFKGKLLKTSIYVAFIILFFMRICLATTYNIEESVELAVNNYIDVLLASENIKIKEKELGQVTEGYDFNISTALEQFKTVDEWTSNIKDETRGTIEFKKLLAENPSIKYTIDRKIREIEIAKLTYIEKKNFTEFDMKQHCYYIWALRQELEHRKKELEFIKKNVSLIKKKIEIGLESQINLKWLQLQQYSIELKIITLKQNIFEAIQLYKLKTGIALDTNINFDFSKEIQAIVNSAIMSINNSLEIANNHVMAKVNKINQQQLENEIDYDKFINQDYSIWGGIQKNSIDTLTETKINNNKEFSLKTAKSYIHDTNEYAERPQHDITYFFGVKKELYPEKNRSKLDMLEGHIEKNKIVSKLHVKQLKQQMLSQHNNLLSLKKKIGVCSFAEKNFFINPDWDKLPPSLDWYIVQNLLDNTLTKYDLIVSKIWLENSYAKNMAYLEYIQKGLKN